MARPKVSGTNMRPPPGRADPWASRMHGTGGAESSMAERERASTRERTGPREPIVLLAAGALALVASAVHPKDYFTWLLEVAPILIAVPVLVATYRRFRLTPLAYRLILL